MLLYVVVVVNSLLDGQLADYNDKNKQVNLILKDCYPLQKIYRQDKCLNFYYLLMLKHKFYSSICPLDFLSFPFLIGILFPCHFIHSGTILSFKKQIQTFYLYPTMFKCLFHTFNALFISSTIL